LSLVVLGRDEEALPELTAFQTDAGQEPLALLSIASAWVTLLANSQNLTKDASASCSRVLAELQQLGKASREAGDTATWIGVTELTAWFAQVLGDDDALFGWKLAHEARKQAGLPPSEVVLVSLARLAYAAGNIRVARGYLAEIPAALGSRVGGVGDVAAVVNTSRNLHSALNELASLLLSSSSPWQDVRLVAELRRDAVGRALRPGRRRRGNLGGWPGGRNGCPLGTAPRRPGSFRVDRRRR
jgi:hypothetical protein